MLAKLREMLLGHPMVSPEKLHVRFGGFGAYSLDIDIFAYIRTADWLEYLAIREDINLRIIDIVGEAGTGFAFPSQTAYLGRDTGLDAERSRGAEATVEEWRSKGQLPFPEFDPQRWEKEDILDYPPRGSPGYVPRAGVSEPARSPPLRRRPYRSRPAADSASAATGSRAPDGNRNLASPGGRHTPQKPRGDPDTPRFPRPPSSREAQRRGDPGDDPASARSSRRSLRIASRIKSEDRSAPRNDEKSQGQTLPYPPCQHSE